MIFDLHCDTIWQIDTELESGKELSLLNSELQVDEKKLVSGGYFAQCFAMYIPNVFEDPYKKCLSMIDLYYRKLKDCSMLAPVYTFTDFEKNKRNGKISAVLTMEDGCPIGEDLNRLTELHRLGVRMVCLTHNIINKIADPNFGRFYEDGTPDRTVPNTKTGLTDFGRVLVKEMNRLGVVIDVSHLSDKGFYDVIELSERPIAASHSNARGLCRDIRNLTDDMLFKLAENEGVTGMNFANHFLNNDPERGRDTIPCVVEHIKYIKKKIGVEHIAIGSDFDGIDPNISLKDASMMGELLHALEKEGFTATEIEKIAYKNALRVFEANMR